MPEPHRLEFNVSKPSDNFPVIELRLLFDRTKDGDGFDEQRARMDAVDAMNLGRQLLTMSMAAIDRHNVTTVQRLVSDLRSEATTGPQTPADGFLDSPGADGACSHDAPQGEQGLSSNHQHAFTYSERYNDYRCECGHVVTQQDIAETRPEGGAEDMDRPPINGGRPTG